LAGRERRQEQPGQPDAPDEPECGDQKQETSRDPPSMRSLAYEGNHQDDCDERGVGDNGVWRPRLQTAKLASLTKIQSDVVRSTVLDPGTVHVGTRFEEMVKSARAGSRPSASSRASAPLHGDP
jgi:hypothetical protein